MRSISTRLTLWYAFAVTLTAMVFILCGHFLIQHSYIEGIDQLNDKEFTEIRNRVKPLMAEGNVEAALEAVKHHAELDAALYFFQVGTSHDEPIFRSANLGEHYLPASVHLSHRTTFSHPELGRLRVGDYEVGGLDVNIASSLKGLDGLFKNLYRIAVGSLLVVFILSLVTGRLLSRIALRPISDIQETASRISASNLSERIEITNTDDEIGRLGSFLNTMFDRLERSFNEIRKFTADASHELKTPLSLIRLGSERIRSALDDADKDTVQLLDNQLEIIDSLNKVVEDLLVLAQADAGTLRLTRKRIDITDLLNDFAEDAQVLCESKGLEFTFTNTCDGQMIGDEVWLRHVLFNLISNALKFTPDGGHIALNSRKSGDRWQVILMDDGPGIPEDKLQLVFQRFYNESDPSGSKGSGLGLALCKGIVDMHQGDIRLSNKREGTGLVVEITLPLSSNE